MVLPLFVTLLIGIFAVGWALHGISSVNYALERVGRDLQLNQALGEEQLQSELDRILKDMGKQNASLHLQLNTDQFGTRVAHVTAAYLFDLHVPLLTKYTIKHEKRAVVVLAPSQ